MQLHISGLFCAGYDAAVYSAASTYLNQQASNKTGSTGNWPYAKKAGIGSQTGRTGNFKPNPTAKPTQLHYCEVCKISCAGSQVRTV